VNQVSQASARALLLTKVHVPEDSFLDAGLLSRGIDNYHIDVRLIDAFVLQAREIIEKVAKRVAANNLASYREMMTASLHRTKSDLSAEHLQVLQFGVIKFLLKQVRHALSKLNEETEAAVAQQQFAGSRSLLATQERLAWLRKNHDDFLFRVNRAVFQQIQREENGLRDLRRQILSKDDCELLNVMFNPMRKSTRRRCMTRYMGCLVPRIFLARVKIKILL
jgi:hypothetical protein